MNFTKLLKDSKELVYGYCHGNRPAFIIYNPDGKIVSAHATQEDYFQRLNRMANKRGYTVDIWKDGIYHNFKLVQ